MTAFELRKRAREALGGSIFANNWLYALLACFVVAAIASVTAVFPVVTIVILGPLAVGFSAALLASFRTKEKINIGEIFTKGLANVGDNIILGLLISIFTALWSLLFVIPGIVMGYAYSMAPYIKADHPEKDAMTCIRESKEMMRGHKFRLFCLQLSFIGWCLLGSLALGLGLLWVAPYMEYAQAAFYEDLKGNAAAEPVVDNDTPAAE